MDAADPEFQSTPSAWRETQPLPAHRRQGGHFNPLPPHGGRRCSRRSQTVLRHFNPLPPHGGRPDRRYCHGKRLCISIHSLRMEGDIRHNFRSSTSTAFQSTPSAWRETRLGLGYRCVDAISIHSLRMEGDAPQILRCSRRSHFNPLPPHGGRPLFELIGGLSEEISIHSLRMEGDPVVCVVSLGTIISIHSLRMEGDRSLFRRTVGKAVISIHSLRMEGDHASISGTTLVRIFQSTPSAWRETQGDGRCNQL